MNLETYQVSRDDFREAIEKGIESATIPPLPEELVSDLRKIGKRSRRALVGSYSAPEQHADCPLVQTALPSSLGTFFARQTFAVNYDHHIKKLLGVKSGKLIVEVID